MSQLEMGEHLCAQHLSALFVRVANNVFARSVIFPQKKFL